jgi:hypothetical protein
MNTMWTSARFRLVAGMIGFISLLPGAAFADIITYMDAWDSLPVVQISQGRNQDCGQNRLVYNQAMQKGFRQAWPGSGDNGEDICWRRTADPLFPQLGLGLWTRCASSSSLECEIR